MSVKLMIIKEPDNYIPTDPMGKAGQQAEHQMAHYLRRAFRDDPKVVVLNDLRIEDRGEIAQIDHLVIHTYGMIIVESKSVTTKVAVNPQGEWARVFGGTKKGMASPILQAKRQGEILKNVLHAHREELVGKVLLGLKQRGFQKMSLDVLVAISDGGIIERKSHVHEVVKADQVPERIKTRAEEYRRANSPLNMHHIPDELLALPFKPEELERIVAFLLAQHQGRNEGAAVPTSHAPKSPVTPRPEPVEGVHAFVCRHCGGNNLAVMHGPYGYYWKCRACEGNTPIQPRCSSCGKRERVRKDGPTLYAECGECGTSRVWHVASSD